MAVMSTASPRECGEATPALVYWLCPQRSAPTVGFSPLRERNASTASTRRSTLPEATSWRAQPVIVMPGSERTVRSSCARESRKTSLAVAPSSAFAALAPCGCSAFWSCTQFESTGPGSM